MKNLTQLQELDISGNRLSGKIPAFFASFTELKKLSISQNNFTDTVPVFLEDLPALNILEILNNEFNFDGIEALVNNNSIHKFKYQSQRKIKLHQTSNVLSVYAGSILSNNTYKWFKDGVLIATIVGDSTYTPTSNGAYTVQVTNSIATKLIL